MGDWFVEQASSGTMVLAVPVALLAGLVSFFSPCVIPLLPGYLSYATGLSGADLENAGRGRMLLGSSLFVLGFGAVFVSFGALFGTIGHLLFEHQRTISVVLGSLTVLMGLAFMGLVPGLQRDWRIHKVPAVGLAAAPMLGVIFGLGWTPCVGPTLGAISTLALNEATVGRGATLSAVYALGLGLPFIVAGLMYKRALTMFAFVRRHQQWVMRIGGAMLVLVGVLLVTGWWDVMVQWIQYQLVSDFEVMI